MENISDKQNLNKEIPKDIEGLDEQLREYRRMLEEHHRYWGRMKRWSILKSAGDKVDSSNL